MRKEAVELYPSSISKAYPSTFNGLYRIALKGFLSIEDLKSVFFLNLFLNLLLKNSEAIMIYWYRILGSDDLFMNTSDSTVSCILFLYFSIVT